MHEVFERVSHIADAGDRLDYWYENIWAEDIDYRAMEGALDDQGPIHGRDAMRAYVAEWVEMLEDFDFAPEEVVDAGGGSFMARIRFSGKIRGSENTVQQHMFVVWTFRDGQMVRGREYSTREEAMLAAGLTESDE